MSAPTSPIASALPGRIRIRHPLLRHPGRHRALADRLATVEGLRVTEGNPAVGSLLVLYDPAHLARPAIEARVTATATAALGLADAEPDETATAASPLKWRINRVAKVAMLGSMAVSLTALGIGKGKRLHAGSGALFLTLMLVHLTVHRKRLFQ